MIFQQMKLGTNVRTSLIFMRVWPGNLFLKLFWLFKVIFKVKGKFQGQVRENIIFNKKIQAHV